MRENRLVTPLTIFLLSWGLCHCVSLVPLALPLSTFSLRTLKTFLSFPSINFSYSSKFYFNFSLYAPSFFLSLLLHFFILSFYFLFCKFLFLFYCSFLLSLLLHFFIPSFYFFYLVNFFFFPIVLQSCPSSPAKHWKAPSHSLSITSNSNAAAATVTHFYQCLFYFGFFVADENLHRSNQSIS
jgi:hypothetical protein